MISKERIIELAKEIGIDLIGFTSCEPFTKMQTVLLDRRKKGQETEFEKRDIELRVNPKATMKDCETLIVLGLSYHVDYPLEEGHLSKGKLSRTSWGKDYHVVLKEMMEQLIKKMERMTQFQHKIYVDTGPLVDRELAKRAGIGWYGKNCSIINQSFGSYIFIGYIMTDLSIEGDHEIENKCGGCTRCIDTCPTGAIEGPYKVNPKKCISYLTQTKEKIPYDLREKMGNNLYGCDTCQSVCPMNTHVEKGENLSFIPQITGGYLDLKEMLEISNKDFKRKYGHVSGSWRGKSIIKRNAIIAMGNSKDRKTIVLLKEQLKDNNSMIRTYAAWSLLKIDKTLGSKILKEHLKEEKDIETSEEIKGLIQYFEGDKNENSYSV